MAILMADGRAVPFSDLAERYMITEVDMDIPVLSKMTDRGCMMMFVTRSAARFPDGNKPLAVILTEDVIEGIAQMAKSGGGSASA